MASSDTVFCWVNKNDTNGVPVGAVTRDCSPEGSRNFVVRAYHDSFILPGNYEEGNDYAEFEYFGNKFSRHWEYLVSNEDVTGTSTMGLLPDI